MNRVIRKPAAPRINRRKFIRWCIYGVPAAMLANTFWWEPEWLKTRRLNLAPRSTSHRLVHFSDLHYKGDRAFLKKVIKRINALEPDLVCFTGDIIEDSKFLPEALELMQGVRAPMYGIPGNHDYWARADFDAVAEAFAAMGGKWLMDQETLTRDGKVNVIGVTCGKAPQFVARTGLKNILMFHYPNWVEKLNGLSFDLMLAGHSHGGQVRLPFFGALLVPFGVGQFEMGLYQTASGPLYVNPGIGYFYFNARFCCRPEVTLIEI
ncbi:MAG: metallophosphoesterase [Verrucomicrobiota bacterium]